MILSKIFSSFTFRFFVGYVAWLGVSVFLVLAVIYAFIAYGFFDDVQQSLKDEVNALAAEYQRSGAEGIDALIKSHSGPDSLIRFFYYVSDAQRQKIAGNLDAWPNIAEGRDGWSGFKPEALMDFLKPVGTEFIAHSRQLPSGEYVLVARHYADVISSTKLVVGALTRSMLATIVLGTLGSAVVSALALRRIEHINTSLRRIMSGDFGERFNIKDSAGDYRRLAKNLNQMLDRIEVLMNGVRQVSDNIAHDLRTPLTRLRGGLSDLQDECDGDESKEKMQSLIDEADGLLGTFNALLRIAQVESGNRRSGFADVDLCTLISDVIELYEPLALEKQQQLNINMTSALTVRGDRNLLFQAFANLMDNAIKYTPEFGVLDIALSLDAEDICIEVADSGVGIPIRDRDKVFQRFYRIEDSRSRHPGNGLGLSLVKAVTTLHAGSIVLEDNQPGLRVIVRLPSLDKETA